MGIAHGPTAWEQVAQGVQVVCKREFDPFSSIRGRFQRLFRGLVGPASRRDGERTDNSIAGARKRLSPLPKTAAQRPASRALGSRSFIYDRPVAKRRVQHGPHHLTSTCDLIGRGYHDVLAHRKISQQPPYLDRNSTLVGTRFPLRQAGPRRLHPACGTARLGTKKHDARRLKPSDYPVHHRRNNRFRNHRDPEPSPKPCTNPLC